MSSQAAIIEHRTYGNFVKPRTPGIWRLGLIGTGAVFAIGILAMVAQAFAGLIAGLLVVALGVIALTPLTIQTRDGRNGWTAALVWWAFRRSVKKGTNVYDPMVLNPNGGEYGPLPGLLARSELVTVADTLGNEFGVIEQGGTAKHFSAVIACESDGSALVDQGDIDVWVARYGNYLADLGDEPGLVAASVTVQSAPDSGAGLQAEVNRLLSVDAPELTRNVLQQAVQKYPRASAHVTTWMTLTWTPTRAATRRITREELLDHIATRIPGLVGALAGTGAGSARAMSADQIAELVADAYAPDRHMPGPAWDQLVPACQAHHDHLSHADTASVTWWTTDAPRSAVHASVLVPLLRPHHDLTRKRVTILYRPHSSDKAAGVADEDLRTAAGHAGARKGEQRATDSRALQAARQQAAEQASGAGLTRFSVMATATTTTGNRHKAEAILSQVSATARLKMRPVTYSQDVAFQTALGIGVVPSAHTRVPSFVREQL